MHDVIKTALSPLLCAHVLLANQCTEKATSIWKNSTTVELKIIHANDILVTFLCEILKSRGSLIFPSQREVSFHRGLVCNWQNESSSQAGIHKCVTEYEPGPRSGPVSQPSGQLPTTPGRFITDERGERIQINMFTLHRKPFLMFCDYLSGTVPGTVN